jgi:uracil-DNA glycosylase
VDIRDQLAEHLRFLTEIGVTGISRDQAWRCRSLDVQGADSSPVAQLPSSPVAQLPSSPVAQLPSSPVAQLPSSRVAQLPSSSAGLRAIREDLGDCTRCKLHRLGRRQIVFGVGNPNAALMFAGEAPGRDEDIKGIPFVGRAGQLLTKMIETTFGLTRDDVYIANVIKCRPPENRNPEPDEVAACEPFLVRQVETIKPKVIVALGTFAAQTLLKTTDPISRLRGRIYNYGGAKLIPTFHPAYLLRSPERKRDAWEDLKLAKSLLP